MQLKESIQIAVLVLVEVLGTQQALNKCQHFPLYFFLPPIILSLGSLLDGSAKNQTQRNGEKAAGRVWSIFKISSESLRFGVHGGGSSRL